MSDLAEEFEETNKFTRKIVEKLIDVVYVYAYAYDSDHYHIVFRFGDEIAKNINRQSAIQHSGEFSVILLLFRAKG